MALNRRSLASLLIGVIASLVGFYMLDRLQSSSCSDHGGVWESARRTCTLPATVRAGVADIGFRDYAIVFLAAVLVAIMLTRLYTFAASRGRR